MQLAYHTFNVEDLQPVLHTCTLIRHECKKIINQKPLKNIYIYFLMRTSCIKTILVLTTFKCLSLQIWNFVIFNN